MIENSNSRRERSPSYGKRIFPLIPRFFIIQVFPVSFSSCRKAKDQGLQAAVLDLFEIPLKKRMKKLTGGWGSINIE
jgi:hypothetical protein